MKFIKAARTFVAGLALTCVCGSKTAAQISCLAGWTPDSIRSEVLGEVRQLRIALPCEYDAAAYNTERYGVLFVLDAQADLLLASAIANAHYLATPAGPIIPRLLIVGVETRNPKRYHDMSPPRPPGNTDPDRGGAPDFMKFLATELRPYLDARYRTLPLTVVAGHSMSGLFAAYAFGQAPELVNAAIALSPSLSFAGAFEQVSAGIKSRTKRGKLFIATSETENNLDSLAHALTLDLATQRHLASIVVHERLPPLTHVLTPLQGMIDGLQFVFRDVSLVPDRVSDFYKASGDTGVAFFEETRRRYMAGARELGLAERFPRSVLTAWANWFGASGHVGGEEELPITAETDKMLARICRELVDSYPELAKGHECLAATLARRQR